MCMNKPFFKQCSLIISIAIIFAIGYTSGLVRGREVMAESVRNVDMTEFWKVWQIVNERYVPTGSEAEEITNEKMVEGAIKGLVESLGDPYSLYYNEEENTAFRESIDGNFEGVGMEVGIADGLLTVIAPLKGTPAERAGLLPGDIIVRIDGEDTAQSTVDEAVSKMRGKAGTEVTLSLYRPSTKEDLEITIKRAVIKVPTLDAKQLEDGVFTIRLYNFTGNITNDFTKAMNDFRKSGSKKLILDLRGNPGGFLDASIDVSSYFLPKGTVVVREDFGNDKKRALRSTGAGYIEDPEFKMVILTNGGSASASEIVAGALHDHGVATIVGTKTFGKGSVQELITTSSGTALKLTVARWLTPEGVSISDGGLTPDVEVEVSKEDIEKGNDPQLAKAIEILTQ